MVEGKTLLVLLLCARCQRSALASQPGLLREGRAQRAVADSGVPFKGAEVTVEGKILVVLLLSACCQHSALASRPGLLREGREC